MFENIVYEKTFWKLFQNFDFKTGERGTPVPSTIKLLWPYSNKLECLPLLFTSHPSLIFAGKAGSQPIFVGSHKYKTWVELSCSGKHPSLLQYVYNRLACLPLQFSSTLV